MTEIKGRWESVRNREKWAARGASFVGKVKATKVVWFPPKPVETGKKAASKAGKATRKTTEKTVGAGRKTVGTGKKSTAAGKKSTGVARNLTAPVRRTKS